MSEFVEVAKDYAFKAHGDQKYGNKPYSYHLEHVVKVLKKFGATDPKLIAAGYLHDTIEDVKGIAKEDIQKLFGGDIANIVYAVTDESGKNRKERKEKTYPKIRANKNAIIVKLADRIANVESSKGSSLMKMYKKEHETFKSKLKRPEEELSGVEAKMWEYLEKLMEK